MKWPRPALNEKGLRGIRNAIFIGVVCWLLIIGGWMVLR
jgi:hypothetical protein